MIAGLKIVDNDEIRVSVTGNSNIIQSNYMINHKEKWTVAEERLFVTALAMIQPGDKALHLYKIPISTFVELWGTNPKKVSVEVKTVLKSLQQKGIYNNRYTFDRTPALTRAVYNDGDDFCLVQIHPDLQKYLINIQTGETGGYTKYKLENALRLNRASAGANANRLYELCRSYAREGKTVIKDLPIADLRNALDMGNKYSQLRGFEEKVIIPSIKKINANTDIVVEYSISGRGKKAVVRFTVGFVGIEAAIDEPVPTFVEIDNEPNTVPDFQPVPESPADEWKELIDGCRSSLADFQKANITFTDEEIVVLKNQALAHGAHETTDIWDYFQFQADFAKANWHTIKNKKAYIQKAFVANYGNWYRA